MQLSNIDWIIIALFFILTMLIGVLVSKKAGSSSSEFFLGGRSMSWWLLGVSMVATTFSADTPNLVTDIVRNNGVAGNWAWWAFLLTGMLTVFVYAKLWRRSGITTDLEFYEMRYSGVQARFLRGFRAIYLGVFFNVMIMATVMLAGIKIGGILLGLPPVTTVLTVSVITVIYSSIGGFKGVIYTDFFQFIIAMIGMVWASIYIVNMPEIGGLSQLLSHSAVQPKLSFLPDLNNMEVLVPLLIIPLAVQWWSVWYPGAEPGGGGYIAQRMLSAKDEKNAIIATLFFNVAHYALRPWPWILIALASMIVFPTVESIQTAFPDMDPSFVKDDLAFSAMLSYLPAGLMGLVIAALIAALMSTISTHLNWGSSYVVNDVYQRFLKPEASESQLVMVGRISTIVLMVLAALFALVLTNALQAFNILLQIGAGTGLLFILRWFWWRINAMCEIVAMVVSFLVALGMEFVVGDQLADHEKLIAGVLVTTIAWLATAWLTKPTDRQVLIRFFKTIRPHAMGWQPVVQQGINEGAITDEHTRTGRLSSEILMMFLGCAGVYALLFGMGYLIYGQIANTVLATGVAVVSAWSMYRLWSKIE
ncbi:MAG: Na+:solute symporter [Saprospiraceae bacterium]|nr:Na+:solute symporter [Saprospiraceae bacterium]MBL0101177.1 Na+:solute symporter [Saprospiraceae bacterium]